MMETISAEQNKAVRDEEKRFSRVYLEITNLCNKSCSFCPGTDRKPGLITEEQFRLVLEKLRPFTSYVYFHLMGEPLLHPSVVDFVKYANGSDFRPCITTNGSLLPRVGDDLISAGVYKVNISIHSFENDLGDDGGYLDGCIDFADKASRAGVLVVLRLWNQGNDNGRNERIISKLKERFTEPWVYGRDGARIRHRLHLDMAEPFDWPDVNADDLGERVYCHGMHDHFGILVDGTVVPCCLDRQGDLKLGNIFEEDLGHILSSERAVKIEQGFRRRMASEELCRRCGYARRFKV